MTAKKLTRIALLSAVLYVSKLALEFLPNFEAVSLLVILYTLVFGKEAFVIVTVFNLFEIVQWGFGTWLITYLYIWPLLVAVTLLLKKYVKEEFLIWAIISGVFGLFFGSFFALSYIPVGLSYAFNYWLSGIPWDFVHCVCNFVIMITVGKPLYKLLKKLNKLYIDG